MRDWAGLTTEEILRNGRAVEGCHCRHSLPGTPDHRAVESATSNGTDSGSSNLMFFCSASERCYCLWADASPRGFNTCYTLPAFSSFSIFRIRILGQFLPPSHRFVCSEASHHRFPWLATCDFFHLHPRRFIVIHLARSIFPDHFTRITLR